MCFLWNLGDYVAGGALPSVTSKIPFKDFEVLIPEDLMSFKRLFVGTLRCVSIYIYIHMFHGPLYPIP